MSSADYYPYDVVPTVFPAKLFDPAKDAATLRKAMKGLGTDEKAIIEVLANRSIGQRIEIANSFKLLFGKDLINNLKSELVGNFEDVIIALMTPLPQFYAKELHDAVAGLGTDEMAIVEILCTLSNYGILTVTALYRQMYGKNLEKDLKDDTSGAFQDLCVLLVQGKRDESSGVNTEAAAADAKTLFEYGLVKGKIVAPFFHKVLVTRSFYQLCVVFDEYKKLAGRDIEDTIKRDFSGDMEKSYLAIVRCAKSNIDFFAERLHGSMAGLGTKDKTLIRIIVSRSEIDLADIKEAFHAMYGKSLATWIKGDCSGDYKKVLLALVGEKTNKPIK